MTRRVTGSGYIYDIPELPLDVLQTLLSNGQLWACVSNLAQVRFVDCTPKLPCSYPTGRAFGTVSFREDTLMGNEVRWQQLGENRYTVTVLTEDATWEPPTKWQHCQHHEYGLRKRELILWGKLDTRPRSKQGGQPTWIQLRIPHPLHYPLEVAYPEDGKNSPRMLRVYIGGYDYTVDGVPVTTRWAQLYQGKKI